MSDDYFSRLEEQMNEERLAHERLLYLARIMAKDCTNLWRSGDGDGGCVINVIRNEFYRYGLKPVKGVSKNRKPIPNKIKKMVFERNAYRCVLCGDYKNLVIDHIHPLSKGGSNHSDNLQTLCWSCNSTKSDKVALDGNH